MSAPTRLDLSGAALPPPAGAHEAWATASGSPLDRIATVMRRRAIKDHDETCTGIELPDGMALVLRLAPVRFTTWKDIAAASGGDEFAAAVQFLVTACKAIVVGDEAMKHPTSGQPMKLTDKAFHEVLSSVLAETVGSPADALRLLFIGGDWEVIAVSNQHIARSQGLLEPREEAPADPFVETADSEQ